MIPQKIHYCWFGGNEIPTILQEYMSTWKTLEEAGYEIVRWDESNCSFDENDFVRKAFAEKRWAFLSDYYRLKSLYEYGGIYLDTDIVITRTFDDLLYEHAFIGYMHSCSLATSVIAAEKGSTFIKKLLDMYELGQFPSADSVLFGKEEKPHAEDNWVANNECVTWNVIKHYPGIYLNNKKQRFQDFLVLPYCYFDAGRIDGKEYCRHMYTNLWRSEIKNPSGNNTMLNRTHIYIAVKVLKTNFWRYRTKKGTSFYKYRKEIINRNNKLLKDETV